MKPSESGINGIMGGSGGLGKWASRPEVPSPHASPITWNTYLAIVRGAHDVRLVLILPRLARDQVVPLGDAGRGHGDSLKARNCTLDWARRASLEVDGPALARDHGHRPGGNRKRDMLGKA